MGFSMCELCHEVAVGCADASVPMAGSVKEVHFQMFAGLSHQVQGAQGGRRRRCAPPTWAHAAAAVGRGSNWLSYSELGASLKIVADLLEHFKLLRILRWRLPGLASPWRRHAEHALRCGHDWRHTLSLAMRSLVCEKLAKIAGKQVRVGMSAVALPSGAARRIKRLQGRKNLDILRSALLQHCGALLLHRLQRRNELRHDKQLRIDRRRRHSGERLRHGSGCWSARKRNLG